MASEGKKRTLLEAIASDEPTLWLELADGGERIPAHRKLLSLACSCVKGLPPGDTWCLKALAVEDRPVPRAVVVAWIKAVYRLSPASYDCDDDGSDNSGDKNGGGAERADALSLLLFADAIGSSSRVMRGCYDSCRAQFDSMHVEIGGERVELQLDGRGYLMIEKNCITELTMTCDREIPISASVAAAMDELGPKAAAQLEPMLHLAYRLGLHDLQEKLHAAIFGNAVFHRSLFTKDVIPSILTDRVMAVVPKAGLRGAWWEHITRKACLDVRHSVLFGRLKAEDSAPIPTELVLGRPLLGTPAGTKLLAKMTSGTAPS